MACYSKYGNKNRDVISENLGCPDGDESAVINLLRMGIYQGLGWDKLKEFQRPAEDMIN